MITAMTTSLIVIALIALAMALGTLVMIRRDGRGPSVPPALALRGPPVPLSRRLVINPGVATDYRGAVAG